MDIAYSLPFTLKINNSPVTLFSQDERQFYQAETSSATVYENRDIELYFHAEDSSARLYLDVLDIVPEGCGVLCDEAGKSYLGVSKNPVFLFKSSGQYDALCVGYFSLVVMAAGRIYYGLLAVKPKLLSQNEWVVMRDDLEKEIAGLAQDLIKSNLGLNNRYTGVLPPEQLHAFMVINQYAKALMSALTDLKDKAKYQIIKEYTAVPTERARASDSETAKHFLSGGQLSNTAYCPARRITYDIQENRLLKKFLQEYERNLDEFIQYTTAVSIESARGAPHALGQPNPVSKELNKFLERATKLRKITGTIKTQPWYLEVGRDKTGRIPHAFALDSRYGVLLRLHQELKHPKWNLALDPHYAYSWKKSSVLYEMWCYIKLCRSLMQRYRVEKPFCVADAQGCSLFPFLSSGTTMRFADETVIVDLVFDQCIPQSHADCVKESTPFYTLSRKNRPDITLNIYAKATGNYIGSVILECKYRRLSSYWFDPQAYSYKANASGKPQILSYYNDTRSQYYYAGVRNTRPVQRVVVLTPDTNGNNSSDCGGSVVNKALRPEAQEQLLEEIVALLCADIEACYQSDKLYCEGGALQALVPAQ